MVRQLLRIVALLDQLIDERLSTVDLVALAIDHIAFEPLPFRLLLLLLALLDLPLQTLIILPFSCHYLGGSRTPSWGGH
jgi:hypothetical protein